MYNIALVENNQLDRMQISACLREVFLNLHKQYTCVECSSGEEFLEIAESGRFDIAIFDVEMKGINGIEAAKSLRAIDRKVIIIFVTSHPNNVFSSFAAEPLNYLLKPLNKGEFSVTLGQAVKKLDYSRFNTYHFSFNGITYGVPVDEILYFEKDMRLIILHMAEHSYRFYGKLTDIESHPKLAAFIRCHNSFMVNPSFILSVTAVKITLEGGISIPVSKSRTKEVQQKYMDYISNLL